LAYPQLAKGYCNKPTCPDIKDEIEFTEKSGSQEAVCTCSNTNRSPTATPTPSALIWPTF